MKKLLTFLTLLMLFYGVGWAADRWVQTDPSNLTTGDIVVIANASTKHAMSNDNGTSAAPSVVSYSLNSDMEISSTVSANMQWVVTKDGNNFKFQVNGTSNYLYCTNTNNGVRVGTNSNNVFTITKLNSTHSSYQQLKNTATSRYVGEYNNQDWRCYTSATEGNIVECNTIFYKKVSDDTPTPTTYNVNIGSMTNGNVTASETSNLEEGDDVTLTVSPNSGYELSTLTVDNTDVTSSVSNNQYTFQMPDHHVNVSATFSEVSSGGGDEYELVSNASTLAAGDEIVLLTGTSGNVKALSTIINTNNIDAIDVSIQSNGKFLRNSNSVEVLELTGSTGNWQFKSTVGNPGKYLQSRTGNNNGLQYNNGTADYSKATVTISSDNAAAIKFNTANRGLICLNGNIFSCYANQGSYGKVYIYRKVQAEKTYDVTVTQATGGTITASPVGEKVVDAGDKITVTATPDAGYELSSWTITGANESAPDANNQITATGNVTITATFSKIQYSITNVVKTNGEVSGAGGTLTNWTGVSTVDGVWGAKVGDVISFRADTYNGYQMLEENISITDAGGNTVQFTFNNNVVTFTMPASNVTITANYTSYRGTIRLAGRFNGNTGWRTGTSGPAFTYDSTNDKYTIDAYFTGEGDGNYFFITYDGNASYPSANGNWVVTNTTGTPSGLTWDGNGHNFAIDNGVYTIELAGDLSTIAFTKKNPTITFSPGAGEVEQGTTVSATSTLTDMIAAIKATDSSAAGDVTITCNPASLNTMGSGQTVTATAAIGNYSVSETATYTVVAANTSMTYQRITSTNDLEVNKKYLLVCESGNYAWAGIGDDGESITITDHETTLESGSTVNVLTLNGREDNYYFSFQNGGNTYYLTYSGTGNNSVSATTTAPGSTWEITFNNDGNAIISDGSSILRAYSGGTDFRVYTSSTNQTVQLYKQTEPVVKDYTITYAEVTGGSATGATEANEGEQITVTVTANDGYAATGITVNPSVEVTDNHDGTYTFTMPASNVTVTPSFAQAYAITYVAEPAAGGLVTGVASAVYDARVEVTVTPNADYQLSGTPTYTYNGITQQLAGAGTAESPYYFNMPGYATTVTANFVKIPHGITVVSTHGDVTGIPETATSGTQVTFTVTPNAGYVVSSVSGTFNNGNSSLNITDNGNGTYTFNMPASDVAITVTYFASEDYELLTDLADINEEDTYLIVGGPSSDTSVHSYVMGTSGSGQADGIALTSSNYDSENDIITSTASMAIINFVKKTEGGETTYALHTAKGYLNNTTTSNSLSYSSTPAYATISLDSDNGSKVAIRLVENSSKGYLSYNTNGNMWKFYGGAQGANYIFKLANKNKVKRPTITGAAGEFLGQYNFIGKDNVSMACATDGATIEYSLDGGNTWQSYSEAFEISTDAAGNTVDVMARATKTDMEPSDAVTATFTCIKPTAPTFGNNEAGAYVNPVFVYPKSALNDRRAYGEESVSFCYTTTGITADASSPAVATSNSNGYYIVLDDNATLSVVTVINDIASDPAGGAYTFSVDAPAFSLAGGNYDGNQQTRLSTGTKTQQNNLSWNTVIYYTTGNTEFAFNATTGEVTSEGWIAYDPTNSPYIDILAANGTTTIKAVTLSNYFNGQSEYRASDVTTETYVLTAANLSITISPAAGTYVNAQNVTLGVKNNIGDYIIYYTTDGSDPNTNGIEYTGTPITVDHDMTIKVYAVDSRTGDGGTATAEAAYKIGIQPVVYSPFPGTIYKGDNDEITVEMFSVTPNAKIYYTVAEGADNWPDDPTTGSTLYSDPVPLETDKIYNFKAIAVIGSLVSSVTPGTFTVDAKGTGWPNVYEMANSSAGTSKTLDNPVQVVYMSTWRNGQDNTYNLPEFCFVRDNSGYGLIYFGNGNITDYNNYAKFQMGDWIEGGKISGTMSQWSQSFINELGGNKDSGYRVTNWPTSSLGNTAILPEETTNLAITQGWTYTEGAFTPSTNDGYKDHIDAEKNLFGHYVHLRKNTISNVTGDGGGNGKHAGIIKDQSEVPLNYYDGFYLFSGYNNSKDYDQAFFNNIQDNGGTFDVYAIVQFYGPNANNSSYSNAPYEIFPIDFEWIYKPVFNINPEPTYIYHEPQTISLTCETEGAQIWYKTSEMEAYELYTGPFEVDATTTIEAYSTLPSKYNDVLESVINRITVTIGSVDEPVITEPSVVKTVGESVTTTITCPTEGATIYYTTDGSDPKTSETRIEYTLGQQLTFDETTTVRAIAMQDDYYSVEAESRTYTFVKSNGIEYTLVTNVNQLNENSVYVIVNKANNMAMSTNQKTNNRDAAGVMFKNVDKTIVYGNDDLAQFTLKKTGNNWYIQTNNSNENGYLSVGNGNTLLTNATADGNAEATITIDGTNADVDKASEAHISFIYNNETTRYLRYWNRDHLFNTYTSETNAPVFLYYIEATPLATIEKEGESGKDYTVADELVGVYFDQSQPHLLWCKDQGNVSIAKSNLAEGEIDFLHDVVDQNKFAAWEDCDQSNWVILDFSGVTDVHNDPEEFLNKYIAPASITGTYTKDTNYKIALKKAPTLNEGSASYTNNVYVATNFVATYQNPGYNGRRVLNPKGTEVHTITYAVWNGSGFSTPETTDMPGSITVDWTYNANPDIAEDLIVNSIYEFTATVGLVSTTPTTPSGAPGLKVNEPIQATGYVLQPLDLSTDKEIDPPTGISGITNGKAVKSVKYVNVAGMVSDVPFQGVNIVVTEYTDGSRSTSKMLRK